MLSEVAIGGVYLPPILVYLAAAIPVFMGLRAVLDRAGLLRFAWHPALLECAVLLATVALLLLLV
ncbi:hypothetical protein QO001_003599 [Methylobacterium brachiatum]|jgi:hypothetical protein|uniref:DUF1656 domain-containing protein n=1 Tax=Methylobacterium brachiatum TaxID=269660 RepID=A0AAJ1WYU5_9HYPH|nr:DUF1656 domain-containing protein [Methylobacterium brachiatum]MCB4801804.1 DUF1656 domain-containing protein [Methylobacterium brachiatum]MDQ0544663.1 hypothetical protein [Methylobacterium brachiatum]